MPKKKTPHKKLYKNKHDLTRLSLLLLLFFTSCLLFFVIVKKTQDSNHAVVSQTVTYSGTTLCADCTGIKTQLTIYNTPPKYTLHMEYEGKDTSITEQGTWIIKSLKNNPEKEMYVLNPKVGGPKTLYEILNKNQIRQLDGDGNPIPETLPFTLTRVD
ncbi:MAG: copper resistance protein NlpE N-terminal domain-containing protein [Candidatus Levybacteria bacterium]|nr:copper resistance protein NlpE N-terminal domain-containing protein [Candidatus Levybacteria bacterium]MBP9814954.1 copper resistance protein NlpE N-terminal domain-containing protein [Candidatus Levybacteria bacterium]